MDKKDEFLKEKDPVDYGDKDYALVTSLSKFTHKFFGVMLLKTDPLFMLADIEERSSRDFRRYKDKDIIVEIVAVDGEPKVLNYWQGKEYDGEDIATALIKEIIKNG